MQICILRLIMIMTYIAHFFTDKLISSRIRLSRNDARASLFTKNLQFINGYKNRLYSYEPQTLLRRMCINEKTELLYTKIDFTSSI